MNFRFCLLIGAIGGTGVGLVRSVHLAQKCHKADAWGSPSAFGLGFDSAATLVTGPMLGLMIGALVYGGGRTFAHLKKTRSVRNKVSQLQAVNRKQ